MSIHPLKSLIENRSKGIHTGVYSICSANKYVIKAAMKKAVQENNYVLIEATANQVNQYGGYTGMKPVDFRDFVFSIAHEIDFDTNKIILGGDHLGPLVWKDMDAMEAMENAAQLIREYVLAGFTKIHLDTSMHLGSDDKSTVLSQEIIAERGALLCDVAEFAWEQLSKENPNALRPVYVIGSEVPVPGGTEEDEDELHITTPSDFECTVDLFHKAFLNKGLDKAWERVIAVVVQPGVEFSDNTIHPYDSEKAKNLTDALKNHPNIVFEGHSTDYQIPEHLRAMVADGIAILKVGPALTFALREALFALSHIESELIEEGKGYEASNFIKVLLDEMTKQPKHWEKYYKGSDHKVLYSMKYSLSDRCRYYLSEENVVQAIKKLQENIDNISIPLPILSQFLPVQYNKIREGTLKNTFEDIVCDRVQNLLDDYSYAIKSN